MKIERESGWLMKICELCEKEACINELCKEHDALRILGEIETCTVCKRHWAKVGYACKFCWEEELRALGELTDKK